MKKLIDRLGISVDHLKCLEEAFLENNEEYARIEDYSNGTLAESLDENGKYRS
ncbi:MAG: hypothetical protein ACEPO8_12685 [Rhodothermaceae bacterium]